MDAVAYPMRQPCPDCGSSDGFVQERNGQFCVFCIECSRFVYNAPKAERGVAQRSVRTRPGIRPSQRRRIFERDGILCVFCGAHPPVQLDLGHLISVDEGRRLTPPIPENELFADENLAVMCNQCNLGFGKSTVALKLMAWCLRINYLRNRRPDDPT